MMMMMMTMVMMTMIVLMITMMMMVVVITFEFLLVSSWSVVVAGHECFNLFILFYAFTQ